MGCGGVWVTVSGNVGACWRGDDCSSTGGVEGEAELGQHAAAAFYAAAAAQAAAWRAWGLVELFA